MKLKKILAGIGRLLLCFVLMFPLSAVRASDQTDVTTIKTTVPDTHVVLLDIGKHGSVFINGKRYTHADKEVSIERLAKQNYVIKADTGWQIESVRYGQDGAQETVKLSKDSFTAAAVSGDDNKLTVIFRGNPENGKTSMGDADTTDKSGQTSPQAGTNVKTGDTVNFVLWLSLLGISASAVFISRKKNR